MARVLDRQKVVWLGLSAAGMCLLDPGGSVCLYLME